MVSYSIAAIAFVAVASAAPLSPAFLEVYPQVGIDAGLSVIKDKSMEVAKDAAALQNTLEGDIKIGEAQTAALEKQLGDTKAKMAADKAEAEKALDEKKTEATKAKA